MREFNTLVAVDPVALEAVLPQKLIEQPARARIRVAIDEADAVVEQALDAR